MANEHVEIHDPFDGQNGISGSIISTKQRQNAEDMIEYRILMAYATRRWPKEAPESARDNPSSPKDTAINDPPPEKIPGEKKKKKRRIWKHLPKVLVCLKPQTKEEVSPDSDGGKEAGRAAFRSGGEH